ncbi:hypothetical protein FACS189418_5220 [Clostridia bacterium]|nr:hypothetical protein FACS189418_5220 [Clostridia bacterium]
MPNNSTQKTLIRLIVITSVFLLCYLLAAQFYQMGYHILDNTIVKSNSEEDFEQVVEIEKGDSLLKISALLKKKKLIQSRFRFFVQAKFYGYSIYPGTYRLNALMGQKEILIKLSSKTGAEAEIETSEAETSEIPTE